jgi:uncharacterized membrane protein HdeD (DUF308 family)
MCCFIFHLLAGTLIFVCVFCLIILIALFVGLAKVLSEISAIEEASKHGWHLHCVFNIFNYIIYYILYYIIVI